ncbi:MAG: formate--phosphoribosylaminoimidazolecarboxamide ligase [Candidatus Caldarchaeum sp.]|nr:formate--phosphoribosylaminoimidazolecarboxamide ligase [Candidatus Caldarchaeum sp.]
MKYDTSRLTISTVASHSALQILRAAKKNGFSTVAVAFGGQGLFYRRFGFVDEILSVEAAEIEKTVPSLKSRNTVFVPHGSFVEYCGPEKAEKFDVPFFGTRGLISVEADQKKKMSLLREAGIPTPEEYQSVEEAEPPVIVKRGGAKGGAGYFLAFNKDELAAKITSFAGPYIFQKYVVGVPVYIHYFSSPMFGRVEIFGADIRYETNVDGRVFGLAEPSFVVVGNKPAVLRESLLPILQAYGESFAKTVEKILGAPMIGPFCLESIITDKLEIKVFEFSGRIVAGTNVYMGVGSPYSVLYFDRPIDMGERIALEIRMAAEKGLLEKVVT